MFSQDRHALRRQFAEAWRKQLAGEPMTPLQAQIADAVLVMVVEFVYRDAARLGRDQWRY